MLITAFVVVAAFVGSANAAAWVSASLNFRALQRVRWLITSCSTTQPFDVTTISAPDGSITAKFVSFGATMTELWVKDKHGEALDIIPGYDDNVCGALASPYDEQE